mmetsp:Transcript_44923/g.106650  ORF Transcript_44923/g.106650 Transcript_44923/m.106650 type:complete len:297 (+) Transcript_44923:332-1222(+)
MPLECLFVLVLGVLEAFDHSKLFVVNEVSFFIAFAALFRPLSSQRLLRGVDLLLLAISHCKGVLHFCPFFLQVCSVLLEGILEHLPFSCLPLRKGRLLVRGLLVISRLRLVSARLGSLPLWDRLSLLIHWRRSILHGRPRASRRNSNADALAFFILTNLTFSLLWLLACCRDAFTCLSSIFGSSRYDWPLLQFCAKLLVQFSEDAKGLVDHSQALHFDILYLTVQVHLHLCLQLLLLVRSILFILHSTATSQCVMHCKFLLQILDLPLVLPDEKLRVKLHIDSGFVGDPHHSGGKP